MPTPVSTPRAPLLWLLLPYMAGVALTGRLHDAGVWAGVAGAGSAMALAGLALTAMRQRWIWATAIVGAGIGCGCASLLLRTSPAAGWASTPREVAVTIEVERVFSPAPKRKTMGGIGRIVSADEHLAELVGQRVYFSAIRKISVTPVRSAQCRVRGVLRALPADIRAGTGFSSYLRNQGVALTLTRAQIAGEVRAAGRFPVFCMQTEERLDNILRHGLDRHPELASILVGMLLGEKAALDARQESAFMRSGTYHIFSVSGLHVGVIAMAIQGLLQLLRVPRRAAVVAGLAVLWLYVQVTGASAPAERAFLMIAFLLGSRLFRLPSNSLAALAAAALVTLLADPWELFNTGFQMSYGVVTALVVMAVPLAERWQAVWRPWRDLPEADWGWWRQALAWGGREFLGAAAATWVALLASTPASIGYFGLFTPGSLLANLVVIPLSSLALVSGFVSLLGGLAGLPAVSLVFNHAAALVIRCMDWLVVRGTELPGMFFPAHFSGTWMPPVALAAVLGVMLACANLGWQRRLGGFWPPVLAVVLAMFFGVKFA